MPTTSTVTYWWSFHPDNPLPGQSRYYPQMTAQPKLTTYLVRGTTSQRAEQVAFECEGFAMAHAKAAELRMAGYKDVVTSLRVEPPQTA